MKTIPIRTSKSALTLVELLVVIALVFTVALFLNVCGPKWGTPIMAAQVKAMSNARQIGLALKMYAGDHNGNYPSFMLKDGKPTTTPVPDSNTAFAQLFPTYVDSENIFWLAKSKFCSASPPDNIYDTPALDTPVNTLKQGENEWAYVPGLNDKSDPAVPLIASGFASSVSHTYSTDQNRRGGVWKGQRAIVVRLDMSAAAEQVNQADMTVHGPNGKGGMTGDIFTTANGARGWLTPENAAVNPK